MKTFYENEKITILLKLPALIFCVIFLSIGTLMAQSHTVPDASGTPICYGTSVLVNACPIQICQGEDLCALTGVFIEWYYGTDVDPTSQGIFTSGVDLFSITVSPSSFPAVYNFMSASGSGVIFPELHSPSNPWWCGIIIPFHVGTPVLPNGTVTPVSCNGGSDGSITTNPSGGGIPVYSFTWNNGAVTQNLTGLNPGVYCVTVTDGSIPACTGSACFTVSQPTAITISNSTLTNVTCNNNPNGQICITAAGGTPPYTYMWVNGNGNCANNLAAGTYTVTVADSKSCMTTFTYSLSAPPPFSLATTVKNVTCFGGNDGSISATASGGTSPYTYNWNVGTGQTINNLVAGVYSLTVSDFNGCMSNYVLSVTQPADIMITAQTVSVGCSGGSTGGINLTVTRGNPSYSFIWSNGSNDQDLANIPAGTYSVTVTDSKNCTKVSSGIVVSQIPSLSLNGTTISVNCAGDNSGSITTTVTGGTTAYTYNWSNGFHTPNLFNLYFGTYSLTVVDANSCTTSNQFVITQPDPMAYQATVKSILCNPDCNGEIHLTVSGGTIPYTYVWQNRAETGPDLTGLCAGTYTFTVTDSHICRVTDKVIIVQPAAPLTVGTSVQNILCNGGTGCISAIPSGGTAPYTFKWSTNSTGSSLCITAGTYCVSVTDNHQCTTSACVSLSQPSRLSYQVTVKAVRCNPTCNGEIHLTVNGGTAPYTYAWSNGALSPVLTGLCTGTYTVTVKDSQGCTVMESNIVSALPGITATITNVTNGSCSGGNGSITVGVSGGTTPYSYLWNTTPVQTTATATNLTTGTYTVLVSDANSCTATASATVSAGGSGNFNCFILAPDCPPFNYMTGNTISVDPNSINPFQVASYTWTLTGPGGWIITSGVHSSVMTYTAGTGTGHFTLTIVQKNTGCVAVCEMDITVQQANEYCTLTQGFYGNSCGAFCNFSNHLSFMNSLLGTTGLTVGCGSNTMYFAPGGAQCIIDLLPGGGPSARITGHNTCSSHPGIQLKNGRIYNILLAQTITLGLNLRLKANLANLTIYSTSLQIATSNGCMGGPGLTHPVSCGNITSGGGYGSGWGWNGGYGSGGGCGGGTSTCCPITIFPDDVLQLLQNIYGGTPTVGNLFQLANNALGNCGNIPNNMLTSINNAVSIINETFDGCAWGAFLDNSQNRPVMPGNNNADQTPSGQITQEETTAIYLNVMPNPFVNTTTIQFSVSKDSHATLDVYNLQGVKVVTLLDHTVNGGETNSIAFTPPPGIGSGIFICILRTDFGTKMIRIMMTH